ncbi:MAG: NAD-dependent epimerase/dehydratase family protein [Deltaproteobacteria bacterium]|nr:MAG: NAD-dependent epimerase/dehydratase family protein [Deltaproteobacteria bacterium]
MRVLVTGAAGFIGSHLCEFLLKEGCSVAGIDNFDPFYDRKFKEENLSLLQGKKNFTFLEGDIRSEEARQFIRTTKPDIIVHLAAMAGVRPSIANPRKYTSVNVGGTVNLLEGAREAGVGKFVFASSSSVYGGNRKVPFSEGDPVDTPISPYAATKKAGELICHTYHVLSGMDVTCLRFFTVYGPRQRPEMAVYLFTEKIYKGEEIPLYAEGENRRDFTYIDDIVDGVWKSMNNMGGFRVYNLGESQVIAVKDLVRVIEGCTGRKARVRHLPPQPGDMPVTYADITRAREELGYDPKTPIEEGIEKFVCWYKKHRLKEG